MLNKKITFIGGGNMAEGIIRGMIQTGTCEAANITVFDIMEKRLEYLKETYSVEVVSDITDSAKTSDILFIAVRPQDAEGVLNQIKEVGNTDALVVSICAGITLDTMTGILGEAQKIARVMPNVLIEAKHGYSGICPSKAVTKEDEAVLEEMFSALGQTLIMPESQFDAFTAFIVVQVLLISCTVLKV